MWFQNATLALIIISHLDIGIQCKIWCFSKFLVKVFSEGDVEKCSVYDGCMTLWLATALCAAAVP